MCVVLLSLILNSALSQGLMLKPHQLDGALEHPLKQLCFSQVTTGKQPRSAKIPPLVPDFQSVAVFVAQDVQAIPCALMSKLPKDIALHTKDAIAVVVPAHSRLLRISSRADLDDGGVLEGQSVKAGQKRQKVKGDAASVKDYPFEVAFGLPWTGNPFQNELAKLVIHL